MSKRFGRNQRRRARELLADREERLTLTTEISRSHTVTIYRLSTELRIIREQLNNAKLILGTNNPAFPAERLNIHPRSGAIKPYIGGQYFEPFTMESRAIEEHGASHFILTHGGYRWGYAISDEALYNYPTSVLANHMASAFTDMILDEINRHDSKPGTGPCSASREQQ